MAPSYAGLEVVPNPPPSPTSPLPVPIAGPVVSCAIGGVVGGVVGVVKHKHKSVQLKASPGSNISDPVPTTKPTPFSPVYKQSDLGNGIGGYDLASTADRSFAFDYDHSGKLDHIVLYRPGSGAIFIVKNYNGTFAPVYSQGSGGEGIGGYDLMSPNDRAFAFDYEHSGKLDYIAFYRGGGGTIWIIGNNNGSFFPVYSGDDGIGGYDLKSTRDRAFAFDNDHSGKLDYIAVYRPGTGTFWILGNNNGNFTPVYSQGDPGLGIGGCDLLSTKDSAFAFDYDHSGKMDHIVIYRPGKGSVWIVKHDGNIFRSAYQQWSPRDGIGGFDLTDSNDSAFTVDYDGTGKQDSLVFYRPGSGIIRILNNNNGTFVPVYGKDDSGTGIGGYDLKSTMDLGYALDYKQSGQLDHIALYRPGAGIFYIVGRL
ncbi:hypothetical protein GP486_005245 [Trichoglossum hirsutum]|uniref:Uncharacterized protein n=1 Tax=Trichoglossum hirsutum TaxID=265104 RepID=A0A9P8L9H2_9PEZI|nr:hypothetical protein GP486_005245 [Trichoglossum hirsutum]